MITMKNILCLSLSVALSLFISSNSQSQQRSDLSCDDVGKIILNAQTEFRAILGRFDSTELDCNYYFSKINFGIDSTTTLQSCKGDQGKFTLHFDMYIGNNEIQAEIEFKDLESGLEKCLPKAKIEELKAANGYKRIVQYTDSKTVLTIFLDEVKNKSEMLPLVSVSVISLL